jgi:protein O-mannosyl-transferase
MNVSRTKLVGMAVVIFAITAWLYWPCVHGGFLAGDDTEYLRQSQRWNGLTWEAIKGAFTSTESYYHPLVRLSHALDYQIWGKNPAGHHATSVIVHALNAALVFGFVWTLLGATAMTTSERFAVAVWTAGVFAVHPLQAESVAWVAGRTQLLCTTFGIGCLWAYAAGARRWMVWALYVAALLCKPMAMSFPFVMLAMDYYPLRRYERSGWGRLLGEKAPLIALAVATGVATMITKSQIGDIIPLATVPPAERVYLMFESLMFYPLKLVWPSHLLPCYPISLTISLDQWPVFGSVLSVVMITTAAIIERRRMPMLAAAWGAYAMLILPVSGLMPTALQVVATRFAYVAMLPLLLLAGAAGIWAWRRSATGARLALIGLLAGQLCVFGSRTRTVIPVWGSDEMETKAVMVDFPDTEEANRVVATMLVDQERAGEALPYAQRDVEIAPELWETHMTLGLVLDRLGRLPEAVAQDEQAVRMNPDVADLHYNLGVAMGKMGRIQEAITYYQRALQIKPNYIAAYIDLGNMFLRLGKFHEAIDNYEQALRINPDVAEAHGNLGAIYQRMGKLPEAVAQYEQAIRIKPDYVTAHFNLGLALEKLGRTTEAIEHYQQALKLRPDFIPASKALARLHASS